MSIFPLWCKWMLTAPMPFEFWGAEYPDFPRLPLKRNHAARTDNGGEPQINISPLPVADWACDYSCSTDLRGFQTNEMNFDVTLTMNKQDLSNFSHTSYPVLLTSEDFENWVLVADRRHAEPQIFFDGTANSSKEVYISTHDTCSKPAAETFTERRTYILACISWRRPVDEAEGNATDVSDWTIDDLQERCDVIG
eukprot:CAMPEP_0170216154 /NCGR_PEP_ID=MMETSP0116_2-20130129/7731_1 /TAXON_ID=400756 /ORGANISM="Durinskia baltica, Strain CSIRO CS-38" /LENGTH=194 /DNA_ID=CAMNT_0010466765 /DNA_START=108 /DNA_END=688 /DNA_ORIENTATION=-